MKKIVAILIISILIACSLEVTAIGTNKENMKVNQLILSQTIINNSDEDLSVNIRGNEMIFSYNISWKKHVIDEEFDYAFGVHTADVDRDGDCDILGASQEGDFIAWWSNEGGDPINWTKFYIDDNFDGATSVFAVDIDNDQDIDVVGSASEAKEIALWINEDNDPITWEKHIIKSGFDFAHEAYCFDIDEDGDMDILGSSSEDHQITWWRNDGGDPITWTEQVIGRNFRGAKSARVADIDNDGMLDVIGAAIEDNQICWWRNDGSDPIKWEEHVIVDDFIGAHRAEVCDLDFDGDVDVIGTAIFGDEISWFRNDGGTPITWTKQVIIEGINKPCIGLPVDIDEDGDIDVVGTAIYGHDVVLFRNDGGNPIVWTKILIDSFFMGAWPGSVEDIDGDGDIDIVVGASFADELAWWESDLYQQPSKPIKPIGPINGKAGVEYSYETVSIDPKQNQLYYMWNWGDGQETEWAGPYYSNEPCTASHIWIEQGDYEIKVKAKNIFDIESDWSEPLTITIPKSKEINIQLILSRFFQRFPMFEKILNQILL